MNLPLRSWVEIDFAAFRHNATVARRLAGEQATLAGVVKGDAYGHGIGLATAALASEVDFFAVANVGEALVVRKICEQLVNNRGISSQSAPDKRILLLGPALPDERSWVVQERLTPVISTLREARAYAALVPKGECLPVHLAVDTGMGRIGVWHEEGVALAEAIGTLPELDLEGVATHLPSADDDRAGTLDELALWRSFLHQLSGKGIHPRYCHAYNSAGTLGYADEAAGNGNFIRPGLMLYGISPLPEKQALLHPVLTWKTRVTLVRDLPAGRSLSYGGTFVTPAPMRVATLGTGYADGYFRHLSGTGADVLLGGMRCPLLGRVTMDQILVDASRVPNLTEGDEAVLIGRQGEEEIGAAALAAKAGTIPWHIFTAITARVRRLPKE